MTTFVTYDRRPAELVSRKARPNGPDVFLLRIAGQLVSACLLDRKLRIGHRAHQAGVVYGAPAGRPVLVSQSERWARDFVAAKAQRAWLERQERIRANRAAQAAIEREAAERAEAAWRQVRGQP